MAKIIYYQHPNKSKELAKGQDYQQFLKDTMTECAIYLRVYHPALK